MHISVLEIRTGSMKQQRQRPGTLSGLLVFFGLVVCLFERFLAGIENAALDESLKVGLGESVIASQLVALQLAKPDHLPDGVIGNS